MGKAKKTFKGYATTSTPCLLPTAVKEDGVKSEELKSKEAKKEDLKEQLQQQQNNPSVEKTIKALPLSTPCDSNAAGLALSIEDEERFTNVVRTWKGNEPSEPVITTRFELETIYETLREAGFEQSAVEEAMSKTGANLRAAFDWLSLNVPIQSLPRHWAAYSVENAKSKAPQTISKQVEKNKAKSQFVPKSRDIIMLDDVLQREKQQLLEAEEKLAIQTKIEKLQELVSLAKAKGEMEEAKRLGKQIGELKNPNKPKELEKKVEVIEKEEEDDFMSSSMFEEEDEEGNKQSIVPKIPTSKFGVARFGGKIPSNWKGTTPKELLLLMMKKRQWTEPKYVKIGDFWNVILAEDDTYSSQLRGENDSIEQELAAMRALYHLFSENFSLEVQLPPDFKEEWRNWQEKEEIDAKERAEANEKPRRDFITKLLASSLTQKLTASSSQTEDDGRKKTENLDSNPKMNENVSLNKTHIHSLLKQSKRNISDFLPIFAIREEFMNKVIENEFMIIVGETGSGKTTQIPQFVLDAWVLLKNDIPSVAISQPRRITATSVSQRVGEELGNSQLCSYQIRGEHTLTSSSCLQFCTTGILLRIGVNDPLFLKYDVIIVDEVHERTLDSDVLLVLLKIAVEERKLIPGCSPLKVILMSATMNAEKLSEYFHHAIILQSSGRTFPVQTFYLEDAIEQSGYDHKQDDERDQASRELVSSISSSLGSEYSKRTLESMDLINENVLNLNLIEKLILKIMEITSQGAILVFLPGIGDITKLENRLYATFYKNQQIKLITLHSSLPQTSKLVFEICKPPIRKIVLSTNIAETGVTIPDVTVVIDTCRVNQISFNEKRGLVVLSEKFCSRASCEQRSGRAGRVQEGICFRLVSKSTFSKFDKFTTPEIKRVPLDQICLRVLSQNLDPREFFPKALDPPSPDSVVKAMERLEHIGAVISSENKTISCLGRLLAKLPVDAKIGKMLIYGTIFKCANSSCVIASIASAEKTIFLDDSKKQFSKYATSDSDLLTETRAFEEWEKSPNKILFAKENFLNVPRLKEIIKVRDQLLQTLTDDLGFEISNENSHLGGILFTAIVCAGSEIASVNFPKPRHEVSENSVVYQCSDGISASLMRNSVGYGKDRGALRAGKDSPLQCRYFAYYERMKTSRVFLMDITPIPTSILVLFAPQVTPHHSSKKLDLGWTCVRCPPRLCAIISKLRSGLDLMLLECFQTGIVTSSTILERIVDFIKCIAGDDR